VNPLEQIALAWQALVRSLLQLHRPRLWAPALILAVLELAAVALIWNFAHPALSAAMAPLLRALGGEPLLHYPNVLLSLPALHARFEVAILAIAGPLLGGATMLLFAAGFRRAALRPAAALGEAASRAASLVAVQLPVTLLGWWLAPALQFLVRPGHAGGLRALLFPVLVAGVALLLRALFLYLPAVVVLEGRNALQAFAELPRTWGRGGWGALLIALVPMIPAAVGPALASRFPALETRFGPEAMAGLEALQILVGVVAWLLYWGSTTLTYLGAVMDFDEWERD
jgi:hypothetical protein